MSKQPVVSMPDYTIYIEHFDGKIWMHANILKWTPRIKAQCKEYSDFVMDTFKQPVYAVNEPEGCKKHVKFMTIMGFVFHCSHDFGGEVRSVYRRDHGKSS